MAVIVVNGTSIQTAINNAAQDDELRVKNVGTYAPFDVTKRLKIVADGSPFRVEGPGPSTNVVQVKAAGASIKGMVVAGAVAQSASCLGIVNVADVTLEDIEAYESAAGYGIRVYGAPSLRAKIIRPHVHHVATGIQFHRGGAGSVVSDPIIHDTDRMFVNDTAGGNDYGGEGMAFYHSTGPILVERPMFNRCFSIPRGGKPASYDYGWDGGHFSSFGAATGITIVGGELRDAPNVLETGINAGDIGQSNITFRGVKVWGQFTGVPPTVTEAGKTYIKANMAFYLRSIDGFTLEDCEFRQMDWHLILAERSGNYATGSVVDHIIAKRNKVWLKPGDNRWFTIGANVPISPTLFTSEGNQIYTQPGGTVASVQGKGKTSDLATLRSWAPAGANWGNTDYWGPEIVAPPPPPVDPCLSVKAERDAALAQIVVKDAQIVGLNTQLTGLQGKLATAKTLGGEVETRGAQIKAL